MIGTVVSSGDQPYYLGSVERYNSGVVIVDDETGHDTIDFEGGRENGCRRTPAMAVTGTSVPVRNRDVRATAHRRRRAAAGAAR
jgi:hypothetical protein